VVPSAKYKTQHEISIGTNMTGLASARASLEPENQPVEAGKGMWTEPVGHRADLGGAASVVTPEDDGTVLAQRAAVTLTFQSVPLTEEGELARDQIQTHVVRLGSMSIWGTALWVAIWTFGLALVVGEVGWVLLGRSAAWSWLPWVLSLGLGAGSFVAAVRTEVKFHTQMAVLTDRNCSWGQFQILTSKTAIFAPGFRPWGRMRVALNTQIWGKVPSASDGNFKEAGGSGLNVVRFERSR
jgi:hypothetical protein